MISLFKRGMGMVFLMAVTFTHAQIATADNGLNATGSNPNKNVGLGGILNNLQTAIDFGSSNSSSNFLLKKGSSNYFFVGNDGNIGIGNTSPGQKLDVTGMIQSSTGFKYGSTIGANLEVYGTYSRLITNSTTDGLMFWTSKNPSSMKWLINNGGRGLMLDGSTANLLFMDGSGNSLAGIGSANGTGHLTFLYSTAAGSQTEGARLTNTGNMGIGITAPTANLHVIQNSASQTGMIVKSYSDAQTANTFEVQDAAGTPVLKVRGTQDWNYGQAAVSINQGNKTNTPALSITNIGSGISGVGFGGSDGGSIILSDFDLHHSPTWTYTNKHAKWRVINNALDGPSVESYSFEHFDQPATMNLMTLKGQTSQTGDMLRIKDGGGTDIFRVKATGGGYFADNVGIGVATPNSNAKLDVNGNIFSNGKIAIGTTDMTKIGTYSLAVNGDAIVNKLKVKVYPWADYVFDDDYPLLPLNELEKFIQTHKHLPEVASATEVEKEGLDVGSNQTILLKKIEELTLYMIEQNKRNELQEKRISELEAELKTIKKETN
jgi:uncharacterized protein YxjI